MRYRATSLGEKQAAAQTCIARSAEINILFDMHERTFNLRNITYLLAYMAYVTATIDVDEAMSGDPARSIPAKQRLELTLRVLTQASAHTPGIQRSIHHLRQKLVQRPDRLVSGTTTPTTAHPSATAQTQSGDLLAVSAGMSSLAESQASGGALDLAFEQLFASLLPEFAVENPISWSEFGMEDALPASTEDMDWLWS